MPEQRPGGEHLAAVAIPAVVGVIGPDVLASTPMTIVAVGGRSVWVEGTAALTPGEAVALGWRFPGQPAGDAPPALAVAVVSGRAETADGVSWRSPLAIEQIDAVDAERLAALEARADRRRGSRP